MKNPVLLIVGFFLSISFNSCTGTREMKKNEKENTESFSNQTESTVFATISKGYCYGRCPVYTMTIFSDGKVILEGKANIEMIGKWETQISKEKISEFIETAEFIGYMDLEDKYDSNITDVPSTKTSIVINGVRKEVMRRDNYPEKILKFEAVFENLLTEASWTEVRE